MKCSLGWIYNLYITWAALYLIGPDRALKATCLFLLIRFIKPLHLKP
jgi:hypothetical protein